MLGDEVAASLLIAFALCDAWCTNGLVSSAVLLKDVISVSDESDTGRSPNSRDS